MRASGALRSAMVESVVARSVMGSMIMWAAWRNIEVVSWDLPRADEVVFAAFCGVAL